MKYIKHLRWYIAGMLTLITTINYLDRQALSVAQIQIEKEFHMTNTDYGYMGFAFLLAYGIMHPFMGRIIDWLGTRRGMAFAAVWWSVASLAHAFSTGIGSFIVFRAFLGIGEAGNFPSCAKAVSEWFPAKERGVATGIFNLGAGTGAMLAPIVIGLLIIHFGWRAAFFATGFIGIAWLILWLKLYHLPENHPKLAPEELAYIKAGQATEIADISEDNKRGVLKEVMGRKEMWGLCIARFLADPVWLFYTLWLPKYFKAERGFDIKEIAFFIWIPFLAADLGSVLGGAISGFFIKRGWPVLKSRKAALCISASMMPMSIAAVYVGSWQLALIFMCVPTFAHQSWSANLLTLPGDLFPKRMVASVYGLSGTLGILFGAVVQIFVGKAADAGSYIPIFIVAGFMHPIAAVMVLALIRPKKKQAVVA